MTVKELLDASVFSFVRCQRGSVSAEHGVGQQKRSLMERLKSPKELELMAGLKKLFDPRGIMNPGKVLSRHTHTHTHSAGH